MNDVRPRQRQSRRERQAETREALLGAAARVFAERGFAGASLDEIAERAGYTRGAVYANFADKDDLFLTLVERHKDAFIRGCDQAASLEGAERRLAAVRELLTGGPPGIAADWIMLWTEFWLHAVRRPDLAARLAEHERRYRAAVARLLRTVASDLGLELPGPAEELAAEVIALDVGLSLQARLAPELGPDLLPRSIARLLGLGPAATTTAAAATPAARGPAAARSAAARSAAARSAAARSAAARSAAARSAAGGPAVSPPAAATPAADGPAPEGDQP